MKPPTVALRIAWRISSVVRAVPLKYYSNSASSWETAASITS
jgi:hypothetical protein